MKLGEEEGKVVGWCGREVCGWMPVNSEDEKALRQMVSRPNGGSLFEVLFFDEIRLAIDHPMQCSSIANVHHDYHEPFRTDKPYPSTHLSPSSLSPSS